MRFFHQELTKSPPQGQNQSLAAQAAPPAVAIVIGASLLDNVVSESLTRPASAPEAADSFSWTQQWYPVAVSDFLDVERPHAIQVLGKHLVLWRDASQTWRCFEDACPHRLAPLSEGRVEADGTLLCAYHAWRFDPSGACAAIPQAKDADTETRHRSRPQACATAYPTQEHHGLIWVWPQAEEPNASQQRSPRLIPEVDSMPERLVLGDWNIRDLPYDWELFMENVADPAHVPVSHHGLVGNRYTDAKYYAMPTARPLSTQEGFAFDITPTAETITYARHDFQPPCLMRIETRFTNGGALILVLYATPTRPGWCRHIGRQILIKTDDDKTPKGLAFFALPMPTWLVHTTAALFLHQDLVFLHHQGQRLAQKPDRWLDQVYTPNPQDTMVITLRQWLAYRAGGGVPWPDHALRAAEKESAPDLYDVWHTHTRHCHTCQTALKRLIWTTRGLWGLAALALVIGIMLDARAAAGYGGLWQIPPTSALGWFALAALLGTASYLLHRLRGLFYRYEFRHADND